jgi:nitroreductase
MRCAPVMVFIARDLNYDFSAYDCGLLAGNILLSAQSLGVGSIVLGSPVRFINDAENSAEILRILGYSENYELCLCVGLGYAAEAPDAKPRDINKVQFVD